MIICKFESHLCSNNSQSMTSCVSWDPFRCSLRHFRQANPYGGSDFRPDGNLFRLWKEARLVSALNGNPPAETAAGAPAPAPETPMLHPLPRRHSHPHQPVGTTVVQHRVCASFSPGVDERCSTSNYVPKFVARFLFDLLYKSHLCSFQLFSGI